MSAATIVDDEGVPQFHVLPTRLIGFGIASILLLLALAIILAALVVSNKSDIDKLNQKINTESQK